MFFNILFGPTHNVFHHFGSLDLLNYSFLLINFKVDKMNKRHDSNVCINIMKCLYMFIYIYKTHLFCLCRFSLIFTNININLCEESIIFCYSSFWKLCFNYISNANSFFGTSLFNFAYLSSMDVDTMKITCIPCIWLLIETRCLFFFHWDHFVFTNGRLLIRKVVGV